MIRDHLDKYNPTSVEDVYRMAAEITGKDEALVKSVVAHPFSYIRMAISNLEEPSIYLHSFGTFTASLAGANKHIRLWIEAYRQNKIDRKYCVDKVSALWALRQKFIQLRINNE
jgi:hypothetical protein